MPRKKPASRKQTPSKQTLPLPLLLAIGGGILLIITAILVLNNNAPKAETPTAIPNVQAQTSSSEVNRVSVADAKAALDAGTALFVDVRGADVYAIGHVAGAVSIPLAEVESRLSELDSGKWIITYCT